jgi:NAD+ synthase
MIGRNVKFNRHVLDINVHDETERIIHFIRKSVGSVFHRRGGVVGISGGVDSSVVLALSVEALGAKNITALMLPEKESSQESIEHAQLIAEQCQVEPIQENITPPLEGYGCYQRRDDAIKRVFPEYNPQKGYKAKIVLPSDILETKTLNFFSLIIVDPEGQEKKQRLSLKDYTHIVAATNFKQRTRMSVLYYHAELRNYAVIGTANKNEHDQGFFVKFGDGGVDIQPIIHLYKTQIYQLAEHLGMPDVILEKPPSSDTYSAHQTQEEFFFRLPFATMDILWYAMEHNIPTNEVAESTNLTEEQVLTAFQDFNMKQKATEYLRTPPLRIPLDTV